MTGTFCALLKLEKKSCDLIVLNGPGAIDAITTTVEIMDRQGRIVRTLEGTKPHVAQGVFSVIEQRLIH